MQIFYELTRINAEFLNFLNRNLLKIYENYRKLTHPKENYIKLTQINEIFRNILRIKTNFQIFGVQEFGDLFPTRLESLESLGSALHSSGEPSGRRAALAA